MRGGVQGAAPPSAHTRTNIVRCLPCMMPGSGCPCKAARVHRTTCSSSSTSSSTSPTSQSSGCKGPAPADKVEEAGQSCPPALPPGRSGSRGACRPRPHLRLPPPRPPSLPPCTPASTYPLSTLHPCLREGVETTQQKQRRRRGPVGRSCTVHTDANGVQKCVRPPPKKGAL